MITRWADQYRCDRCRKLGQVLHDVPRGPDKGDGWTHFGMPFIRPDGVAYNDLCDDCSALPIGELVKDPATIGA